MSSAGDLFPILHENENWLAIHKPAGLVCHPTKGDERSSLVGRLRLHLNEPGHLVNRLDRETSGIILAAKNARSSAELRKLWQRGAVTKTYLAITRGHPDDDAGVINAPLGSDESNEVTIKDRVRSDGAHAETSYRVLSRFSRAEGEFSLLEVQPRTGRKHQIRIHLEHIGHPIVGDKLYGGDPTCYLDFVYDRLTEVQRAHLLLPCQALHASRLTFTWRRQEWSFHAPPEPWFIDFLPATARQTLPAFPEPGFAVSPIHAE
jgi:23S rRNA pseudouridine1911/1915/1917 synthase